MRADSSSEPGRNTDLLPGAAVRVRALVVLCLAAVVLAIPTAARAQPVPSMLLHSHRSTQAALLPAPEATASGELFAGESSSWNFEQCLGGLNYGAPYKLAISYGAGFVRESDADICIPVVGRIGLGAMGVSTGIALSSGPFGSGLALTAGVLRSFNSPLNALPNRNHAGVSLHLWPLLGLGGEIGLYQRLGKDTEPVSRSRKLLVWSAGFGF